MNGTILLLWGMGTVYVSWLISASVVLEATIPLLVVADVVSYLGIGFYIFQDILKNW